MEMRDRFVSTRFPYLPVHLEIGPVAGDLEALIDTGFDGHLAVTPDLVGSRPPTGHSRWTLADGSTVLAPVYRGALRIGQFTPFIVTVIAIGDEAILGRGVTDRFSVILDHGRQVVLEP